ncbi:MAG: DUF4265 domain-containing protein [Pseudomonadales bacterium]|nr:DUF4265 domain-containing protein [Pseudomonadales bacterium]
MTLSSMTLSSPPDHSASNEETVLLPLLAGYRPDGEAIVEQVRAELLTDAEQNERAQLFRLQHSPAFVRGLATGDRIRFPADTPEGYLLVQRSGNLCIRVMNRHSMVPVLQALRPEMELLDGRMDMETPRLAVFSIHVSIGFQTVETLLDRVTGQFPGTVWYYGNVYDAADGVTPLDWWQAFLAPV